MLGMGSSVSHDQKRKKQVKDNRWMDEKKYVKDVKIDILLCKA